MPMPELLSPKPSNLKPKMLTSQSPKPRPRNQEPPEPNLPKSNTKSNRNINPLPIIANCKSYALDTSRISYTVNCKP